MKLTNRKVLRVLGIFLILPLFYLPGCADKECKQTVQDLAVIHNATGWDLQLYVCKGTYGESLLRLLPTTSGVVNIGTHQESTGSEALGVCKTKNTKNSNVSLSLSPNSYGSVLLCYRQVDNTYIVTLINQGCPAGYVTQSSAEPCPVYSN